MRLVIAALAALSLAMPASAAADTPDVPNPDKVVCKVKAKTGTRFPNKTCRTRAEWEKITAENKRTASEMIDKPIIANDCRGAGC